MCLSVGFRTYTTRPRGAAAYANSIAIDTNGNAYITGYTEGNFPTRNAYQPNYIPGYSNTFITELNATGSDLIYSTLFGDQKTQGTAIAVDNNGNIYLTGSTTGTLPVTAGAYRQNVAGSTDAFVVKLNPHNSGPASLIYSTYLGGSGYDIGQGIATDSAGNAYIVGGAKSSNFPTLNAFQSSNNTLSSIFITELNSNGSALIYSTYLGANSYATAVTLDSSSNVYVTGSTITSTLPITPDAFYKGNSDYSSGDEGFLAELNPAAGSNSLLYLTYLPGGRGKAIAIDNSSNVYVVGTAGNDYTGTSTNVIKLAFKPVASELPKSLGGCNGGSLRSTEFVQLMSISEQLPCQRINPNTGNFVASAVDLELASPPEAPGMGLVWGRNYNSLDSVTNGPMGLGWRYSYQWDVVTSPDSQVVTITQPSGRRDVFNAQPGATSIFTSTRLTDAVLTQTGLAQYTLTDLDESNYFFANGHITTMTDRVGNALNFAYNNPNNTLSLVTLCLSYCNQTGYVAVQTLTVGANSSGQITGVSDQSGRSVSFDYQGGNTLKTVTDARGQLSQLQYYDATPQNQNRLQSLTDPNTHQVIYLSYETATGRVTQTKDAQNQLTQVSYPYPFVTLLTDARGNQTYYYWDNYYRTGQVLDTNGNTHSYHFDSRDHLLQATDASSHQTYYTYNVLGLSTGSTQPVTVNGTPVVYSSAVAYNQRNQPTTITDTRGFVTTMAYDANGDNPTTITDPLNNYVTYHYDDPAHLGRVTSKSTSNQMAVVYQYDANGFFQQTTRTFNTLKNSGPTPTTPQQVSLAITYTFDSVGRLTDQSDNYDTASVPSPLPTVHYAYDPNDHVTGARNQLSENASNQYDYAGNAITTTNFLGQTTTTNYDELNRPITLTRSLNSGLYGYNLVTGYNYDPNSNLITTTVTNSPISATTGNIYDKLNRVITTTTPLKAGGAMTTGYIYDNVGNIISSRQLNTTNGGSGDQLTSFSYDELNRTISTTLGTGYYNYQRRATLDPAGNVRLTQQSKIAGTAVTNWNDPAQVITAAVTYDALDRPLTSQVNASTVITNPYLLTTSYNYNDSQNLYNTTTPYSINSVMQKDPAGRAIIATTNPASGGVIQPGATSQTSYSFYDPRGLPVHTIDALNNWHDTGYDLLRRQTSATAYSGSAGTGTALTSSTYYTDTRNPQVTTVGPAPNYVHQDVYMDDANRPFASVIYSGTDTSANPTYKPQGQLCTVYSYDAQNNLVELDEANGQVHTYKYETTKWLTQAVQQPIPTNLTYGPLCVISTRQSQARAQGVQANAATSDLITNYSYDQVGNILTVSDANQHGTTNGYDVLNRLTTTQDALGKTWLKQYDGLSRVITATDPKQQATGYNYDNASRLLTMTNPTKITTSYTYNDGGQPLTMQDSFGSRGGVNTSYQYDGLNRLTNVNNASQQFALAYSYDNLNRRAGLTFSSVSSGNVPRTVSYGYDGLSRPLTVTNWAASPQTLTYNYLGERLDNQLYPNGTKAQYSYDGASRLLGVNNTKTSDNSIIFGVSYTLDGGGNRLTANETMGAGGSSSTRSLTYGYDGLSRLISDTEQVSGATGGPTVRNYQYDNVGNRQQLSLTIPDSGGGGVPGTVFTNNYGYDIADHMITQTASSVSTAGGTVTPLNNYGYNYDNNGSVISDSNTLSSIVTRTTYTYDARNRMTNWQQSTTGSGTGRASWVYDGANTRVSSTFLGADNTNLNTNYVTDVASGLPTVVQEIRNGQSNNYLYGIASPTPLYQEQVGNNAGAAWYHSDGLGCVRALTDGTSGTLLNGYGYSAFGSTSQTMGSSTITNTHGFGGEQQDPTGLYYNRGRYYNANIGRFTSRDSYAGSGYNPVSQNRFVYAGNNPTRYTDPSGNYYPDEDSSSGKRIVVGPNGYQDKNTGSSTNAGQVTNSSGYTEYDDYYTVSEGGRNHILNGDENGGGHRYGANNDLDKTKFPKEWTDNEIIDAIESVANGPDVSNPPRPDGRKDVYGIIKGVPIHVVLGVPGSGDIITGHPDKDYPYQKDPRFDINEPEQYAPVKIDSRYKQSNSNPIMFDPGINFGSGTTTHLGYSPPFGSSTTFPISSQTAPNTTTKPVVNEGNSSTSFPMPYAYNPRGTTFPAIRSQDLIIVTAELFALFGIIIVGLPAGV